MKSKIKELKDILVEWKSMESKIKELKDILVEWESRKTKAQKDGLIGSEAAAGSVIHGINLALSILKGPSNQVDANVCSCDARHGKYDSDMLYYCINCKGVIPQR